MGMGMIRWERQGSKNKKVISAHLYSGGLKLQCIAIVTFFVDHPRIYLSVSSSVCLSDDNFRKPGRRQFLFCTSAVFPANTGHLRI